MNLTFLFKVGGAVNPGELPLGVYSPRGVCGKSHKTHAGQGSYFLSNLCTVPIVSPVLSPVNST